VIKILIKYRDEIERYCTENNLSIEKVFYSPHSYNDKRVVVLHFDPEKGKQGLLNETPATTTLLIEIGDGKLRFVQTEHTRKYLGMTEEAKPAAIPKAAVA
jgi:hypothetical protein